MALEQALESYFESQYDVWGLHFEPLAPSRLSSVDGMAGAQNRQQSHAEAGCRSHSIRWHLWWFMWFIRGFMGIYVDL